MLCPIEFLRGSNNMHTYWRINPIVLSEISVICKYAKNFFLQLILILAIAESLN